MTRNFELFPNDDNGDVLWEMHQDGDDLTEPHEIEFSIVFDSKEKAHQGALYLLDQEQKISLYNDEEEPDEWTIVIYVLMQPIYQDIVDLEEWITKIAEQNSGEYDGWGCFSYTYEQDDEE